MCIFFSLTSECVLFSVVHKCMTWDARRIVSSSLILKVMSLSPFRFISFWVQGCFQGGGWKLSCDYVSLDFLRFHYLSLDYLSFNYVSFIYLSFDYQSFDYLGLKLSDPEIDGDRFPFWIQPNPADQSLFGNSRHQVHSVLYSRQFYYFADVVKFLWTILRQY